MQNTDVSVVVIGRNEGARLIRCLQSVRAINGPFAAMELIYVDSDSSDGSAEVAARFASKVVKLSNQEASAARARNAGWRAASGLFVLFLDGDTILDPTFLELACREFSNPQVAVVWGHRRELHPGQSIFNRVADLDWIYPPGITDFCGGDSLMRRSALEQTEGFDPSLIAGEEPELCRRIRAAGSVIIHIDAPMTLHDLTLLSWRQYWRRAVRSGYAYAEISTRFRDASDRFWLRESRRNAMQVASYAGALVCGALASVRGRSPLPALLTLGGFTLLIARTFRKVRWKTDSWETRLLYAIHSHVQQIPIFAGQMCFCFDRRRNGQGRLIEYKNVDG